MNSARSIADWRKVQAKLTHISLSLTLTFILNSLSQYRGAYLDNCNLASCNSSATDANSTLREALWRATEEQIAAAVAKGNT